MKHCANENCADLVRYGVRGEYFDRIHVYPKCNEPLIEGPGPPPPTIEWADRVCIAQFRHLPMAHVARAKLESAGIAASVQDQHLSSIQWLYSAAVGGAKVWVSRGDAGEATRILGEDAPPVQDEAATPEPEDLCPSCGAVVPAGRLAHRSKALSLLIGIPFVLRRRTRRCHACGHRWRPRLESAA